MKKIKSRLLKRSNILRYSTVYTLILSLGLFGILYFNEVDFDRNLGVTGFFFGLIQLVYSKFESKNPKMRNIVFISKSTSSFSQSIYKGLRDSVEINQNISIRAIFPEQYRSASETVSWQINELRQNLLVTKADAIVIIPAKDEGELWQNLVTLTSKGITIICIDVKPKGLYFDTAKLPRPYFISSDFSAGGIFLGEIIKGFINNQSTKFIGALGPDGSWPAMERCSRMLSSIIHEKGITNCSWVKLDSWSSDESAQKLVKKISSIDIDSVNELIVFAGNDKIAISLLHKISVEISKKIRIIGYDGLKDENNQLMLNQYSEFLATIDTLPIEQGKSSGLIINSIYNGDMPDFKSFYVKPRSILKTISH